MALRRGLWHRLVVVMLPPGASRFCIPVRRQVFADTPSRRIGSSTRQSLAEFRCARFQCLQAFCRPSVQADLSLGASVYSRKAQELAVAEIPAYASALVFSGDRTCRSPFAKYSRRGIGVRRIQWAEGRVRLLRFDKPRIRCGLPASHSPVGD